MSANIANNTGVAGDAYTKFLQNKIVVAEDFGFDPNNTYMPSILFPHQRDIVEWCIEGGRRAIFASFGLGKSMMQLSIGEQVIRHTNKPFLICLPLGVIGEFKRDNAVLNENRTEPIDLEYISDTSVVEQIETKIYVTNYERVRKGDIDPTLFAGVSFDEASVLRNLNTQTSEYVLNYFKQIPYRYVATATPTPNKLIEILNYADFLGVIDRGHALTRFFKRDSTKAGNLTLYENKKKEFWQWVSTWAVFINKPSDLGYDDTGYDLPKMHIHEIEVQRVETEIIKNKKGENVLFRDNSKSLIDASREKRATIDLRIERASEIIASKPDTNWILWHHLEDERKTIEANLKDKYAIKSVYGSQKNNIKEQNLIDFSNGDFQILSTKPKIAGSGCNFQHTCNNMIFVGIDYKFNDFIQAVHRIYRFKQSKEVHIYIIHTNNEHHILKTLKAKWRNHINLQTEMINLVRNYGLNKNKIKSDMSRQLFSKIRSHKVGNATVYNNDTVDQHRKMASNSTDMILTSIPFGDHYEYSDNYNCFGHNNGNDEFFKQMQYLTPELYRTLKPGKVAAIHVKDRIRYSYQTGAGFTTVDDFSGQTVNHFTKGYVKQEMLSITDSLNMFFNIYFPNGVNNKTADEVPFNEKVKLLSGKNELVKPMMERYEALKEDYKERFHLLGKITVTTDVVRENNQTYRLGHSEQCKDATKMGVGLPEYILLFRKPPSDTGNAYADEPCKKEKSDYDLGTWQLDAHAYWKSSGDRFMSSEEMDIRTVKTIVNQWKKYDQNHIYDFKEHLRACLDMDEKDKLSRLFMTLPPHSNSDLVWTDINRMDTLNANQANRKKEKHICPLQLPIIERLINRFTMEGDLIDDPFGGLFSTAYKALQMNRKATSCELNPDYYDDGLFYLKSIEYKINVPTLFDMLAAPAA